MDNNAAVSLPWYRALNREQWRVLLASNLGWLFDGFEIYALFLTVGFALHQLLDAAQYAANPALRRVCARNDGVRLGHRRGDRRHRRRLHRPQAYYDAGDSCLLADHRAERLRLGLAVSHSQCCAFSPAWELARNG
jgi:hypothetical protein